MKKLVVLFVFLFGLVTNAGAISEGLLESKNILIETKDVCSVTVTLYENGEEVGSGTYSDDTGDCEMAEAMAYFIAYFGG